MIKLKSDTQMTPALLAAIIKKFQAEYMPNFKRLGDYYLVKNEIMNRTMKDPTKPNNKLPHGFAKYITNMATSYFIGEGIKYDSDDKEYLEELKAVFDLNLNDNVNYEVSKEASKKGISFELLYTDSNAQIRYKNFKADEFIPIYSTSVDQFLLYGIRVFSTTDLVTNAKVNYATVYSATEIIEYKETDGNYVEVERRTHEFDDVPVLVYWNNEEIKGDYEDVIALIDAYDKAQSDTSNDFEYFTDAYLKIKGASGIDTDGEESDDSSGGIKTLKEERVLFIPEGGDADWLIKTINDTAVENFKDRLYSDIFFLSQVPALTDESFSGNLTGVAIRYKLIGLEQLSSTKANKFTPAERKKIKLITRILNIKKNKNYDPTSIKIVYSANMIDNESEQIENAQKLEGIASKRTQLSMLPKSIVSDPDAEIVQIDKEKKLDGMDLNV